MHAFLEPYSSQFSSLHSQFSSHLHSIPIPLTINSHSSLPCKEFRHSPATFGQVPANWSVRLNAQWGNLKHLPVIDLFYQFFLSLYILAYIYLYWWTNERELLELTFDPSQFLLQKQDLLTKTSHLSGRWLHSRRYWLSQVKHELREDSVLEWTRYKETGIKSDCTEKWYFWLRREMIFLIVQRNDIFDCTEKWYFWLYREMIFLIVQKTDIFDCTEKWYFRFYREIIFSIVKRNYILSTMIFLPLWSF